VRYIGLFYPVISAFIFILDYKKWKFISAMALVPLIILISTVQSVKNKTAELFGYETFSGFSGWAIANNAVAIIPHIELDPRQIPDKQIAAMHSLVTSFNDTCYSWYHIKDTDFMWDKLFPGKALLGYNANQMRIPYNAAWVYTGTQWKDYGTFLRNKYPLQFFRYYMVPNMGGVFEVFPYGSEKQYVPDNTSKEYFQVPVDKYEFKSTLFDNVYGYRAVLYYVMLFGFGDIQYFKKKNNSAAKSVRQISTFYSHICIFICSDEHLLAPDTKLPIFNSCISGGNCNCCFVGKQDNWKTQRSSFRQHQIRQHFMKCFLFLFYPEKLIITKYSGIPIVILKGKVTPNAIGM